jgi:putative FmdB family regulatory protein
MPLYEFQCQTCGKVFSEFRKIDSTEIMVCPKCGSGRTTRLFSTPHFRLGSKDRIRDVSWIDHDIEKKVKKSS